MSADVLQEATFRLETADGKLAGTAVLVDGDGTMLTCHHVAATASKLVAVGRGGLRAQIEWLTQADEVLAGCDLALVRLSEGIYLPAAVPVLSAATGGPFQTRAQLAEGQAFHEGAPLTGTVTGDMMVGYRHGDRTYAITGGLVTGFQVLSGMSGSPVWDSVRGAVVGLLAVGSTERGNIGGFVSPLAQATESEALRSLLRRNEATIGRFGDSPNRVAASLLLRSATETTLQRLRDRGIFVASSHVVAREGFDQALVNFLRSETLAFPIISAAGQGKTTLLAKLAEQPSQRPTWLVRGADFPTDQFPMQVLDGMLAGSVRLPTGCSLQAMANYGEPRPLLLLDGLNEVPLEPRRISDEWLPDLLGSIERAGWRLIFTTRRELFDRIEDKGIVIAKLFKASPANPQDSPGWFRLGEFTTDEATQAAVAYGLPRNLTRSIGRQPLMFRLATRDSNMQHRSIVLSSYLKELLDRAMGDLEGHHPDGVRAQLIKLAAAAANQPSGVLGFNHDELPEKAVVKALCDANILETVEAGYRIIFDEVSDFLHALNLATGDVARWLEAPPNVVTLAIELLLDRNAAAAVNAAEQIATGKEGSYDPLRSFRIVLRLEKRPEMEPAKALAVRALINADLVQDAIVAETDLPGALPVPVLRTLLRAAILEEDGYGWREKDVYSKLHRSNTEGIARTELGLTRLVADLVREDTIDGVGLLIGLLADTTPLSDNGKPKASSEATVGSFALCMVFAHRERIGVDRIFKEVILTERQGGDSLLEAFCEDEPVLVAEQLEEAYEGSSGISPVFLRKAWMTLLQKAEAGETIRARIREGLLRLLDRLDERELQEIYLAAVPTNLFSRDVLERLFERVVGSTWLHRATLIAGIRAGLTNISDALAIAKQRDWASAFVSDLATSWKSDDSWVSLNDIVPLVSTFFAPREKLSTEQRILVEWMSYEPTLEQAKISGFCDYLEQVIAVGNPNDVELLVIPAFARTSVLSPGQRAFREWLGTSLSKARQASSIAPMALKQAVSMRAGTDELPSSALVLARMVNVGDLFLLALSDYSPAKMKTILNIMLKEARRRDEDLEDLLHLQSIFADDSSSPSQHRAQFLDYVMALRRR